jgi:hypothetical protein
VAQHPRHRKTGRQCCRLRAFAEARAIRRK